MRKKKHTFRLAGLADDR